MRISFLFLGLLFSLPQVSAQLQIPKLETSAAASTLLISTVEATEVPLNLAQAMLQPETKIFTNQDSQIANQSLMYRPHLAFFCRVEVELEQAAKIPIRFRLGSVDYVDYLEGKRSQ